MIQLDSSDLFSPVGVHRLMAYEGMTQAQAFDLLAARVHDPELQAMLAQCNASPQGRKLLAEVRRYWDAEGLPVIWDNLLELTPA